MPVLTFNTNNQCAPIKASHPCWGSPPLSRRACPVTASSSRVREPGQRWGSSLASRPTSRYWAGNPSPEISFNAHPPHRWATEWRLLSSQCPSPHLNIGLPFWAQSPRRRLNWTIRFNGGPRWRRPGPEEPLAHAENNGTRLWDACAQARCGRRGHQGEGRGALRGSRPCGAASPGRPSRP